MRGGKVHSGTPLKHAAVRVHASSTSTSTSGVKPAATRSETVNRGGRTIRSQQELIVSWAGAGIYFFWELGAIKYLAERFDLCKVSMVGASGGALVAVLAACGINADRVVERAYQLSVEHNIWGRPLGLLGTSGSLIERWLDDLLPDDAHEVCRGRITIIVTTLPDMTQVGISDFTSKKDLINVCMASSHVPFFMDLKPSRLCRGRHCMDGSFPDFLTGQNSEMLRKGPGRDSKTVVFDYFDDSRLQRSGRMDMLAIKSHEEIQRMYRLGYEYAAGLHANGRFSSYKLSELLLQGDHSHAWHVSEVLVPSSAHATTRSPLGSHGGGDGGAPQAGGLASGGGQLPQQPQPTSVAHASQGMGLVLELQQDEEELAAAA